MINTTDRRRNGAPGRRDGAASGPPAALPTLPAPALASFLALALTTVLATACGSDGDRAANPFAGTPWTVDGPELRIGSVDDPEYVFGPLTVLAQGPDGLLYTAHWREATVRRWGPDGTPAGSVGREGEGPGEFRAVEGLGFFGDSLWVWDGRGYRVSYFDLAGNFLGSTSPKVDIGSAEGSPPRPSTPLRDGTFVGRAPGWSQEIALGNLTGTPYVRMAADGQTLAHIWTLPYEPHDVFAILRDGGGSFSSQPFGDDFRATAGPRGLLVLDRRVWTGTGEPTVTVSRIDLDGDTLFTAAVPYEPVPLPAERFDSVVAEWAERWSDRGRFSASAADVREAMYRPSHLPAVSAMLEAQDGTIWLRRFDPVQSETGELMTEWWVLDSEGAPLSRALMPSDLSVRTISEDTVWGVERDELDVEYVVRYRLVKGA